MEPTGNEGERGELEGACEAVATIEHIGHPGFAAKEVITVEERRVC